MSHERLKIYTGFFFCLLLSLPLLFQITGISEISDSEFLGREKRGRFEMHDLNFKNFPSQFDAWFSDRYGLRDELVTLDALYNYLIWDRAIDPLDVMVGRDRFLFLGDGYEEVVKQTMNVLNFSDSQLTFFIGFLKNLRKRFNAEGVELYFTVAPNKPSIYGEYLPRRFKPDEFRKNVYRQLTCALDATDVKFVDLMAPLRSAKVKYREHLYYRTDSHWSNLGAYISYSQMIGKMKEDFPYLEALELEKSKAGELPSVCDLALSSHIPGLMDTAIYLKFDRPLLPLNKKRVSLNNALGQGTATAGDITLDSVENRKASNPLKLLLFGDSFSIGLSEFLNQTFYETVYNHHADIFDPRANWLVSMQTFKPDIVLFEIGERLMLDFCMKNLTVSGNKPGDRQMNSRKILYGKKGGSINGCIFKKSKFIQGVEPLADSLIIRTSGVDPFIVLEKILQVEGRKGLFVEVELESFHKEDIFQLFFQTKQEPFFSEEKSFITTLKRGVNSVCFSTGQQDLNGFLRLDLGVKPGILVLNSIKIRSGEI